MNPDPTAAPVYMDRTTPSHALPPIAATVAEARAAEPIPLDQPASNPFPTLTIPPSCPNCGGRPLGSGIISTAAKARIFRCESCGTTWH